MDDAWQILDHKILACTEALMKWNDNVFRYVRK